LDDIIKILGKEADIIDVNKLKDNIDKL